MFDLLYPAPLSSASCTSNHHYAERARAFALRVPHSEGPRIEGMGEIKLKNVAPLLLHTTPGIQRTPAPKAGKAWVFMIVS